MTITALKFCGREVFVCSFGDVLSVRIAPAFVTLIVAACQKDIDENLRVANALLEKGCNEFCCIGPESEKLHDQLDNLIEDAGLIDVVTTWHKDITEGCEYFLFAAGGQSVPLVGLISKHPQILDVLNKIESL